MSFTRNTYVKLTGSEALSFTKLWRKLKVAPVWVGCHNDVHLAHWSEKEPLLTLAAFSLYLGNFCFTHVAVRTMFPVFLCKLPRAWSTLLCDVCVKNPSSSLYYGFKFFQRNSVIVNILGCEKSNLYSCIKRRYINVLWSKRRSKSMHWKFPMCSSMYAAGRRSHVSHLATVSWVRVAEVQRFLNKCSHVLDVFLKPYIWCICFVIRFVRVMWSRITTLKTHYKRYFFSLII